jgi:hypothetical protein
MTESMLAAEKPCSKKTFPAASNILSRRSSADRLLRAGIMNSSRQKGSILNAVTTVTGHVKLIGIDERPVATDKH